MGAVISKRYIPKISPDNIPIEARRRVQTQIPSIEKVNTLQLIQLLEALEMQKIELELQNEELSATMNYLQQSEQRYHRLYKYASVGYIQTDKNFEILDFNETTKRFLGLDNFSLQNTKLTKFVYNKDQDILYLHKRDLLNTGKRQTSEIRLVHRNNQLVPLTIISELSIDDNDDSSVYSTLIDFSDGGSIQKIPAGNLTGDKNDIAKLQSLISEKDKFISILSHDLRSPFHSLLNYIDILQSDIEIFDRTTLYDFIRKIKNITENTYNLLSDLLKLSQLKNNKLPFTPESIDLMKLADNSIKTLEQASEQKHITINNAIPLTIRVFADRTMTENIFRNLIENAIKFTHQNGIIDISAEEFSPAFITISIIDNGIGIPRQLLPKLFLLHERTGRKGTNNEVSSGLGLAICKAFVELNGGFINIHSIENQGTRVKILLPRYSQEDKTN